MAEQKQAGQLLVELAQVMDKLRGPEGCPWDREQDHISLKPYLVEEAYEVLEAIELGDMHKLAEELGDLLLQIVFHAQIAKERGEFDLTEPLQQIVAKLKRRHPHVFGDVQVESSQQVALNWEEIKARERRGQETASLLDRVPRNMPALMQAYKIQEKAARVGFDWDDIGGAWDKVREEKAELERAIASGDRSQIGEELGDLLFAIVNVARFLEVEPETALLSTVMKFRHRFAYIEEQAQAAGKALETYSLQELDKWWEEAKRK
ncbi:MAG: nucleoside triphosphate pyrophosphohydrolase [Firmicutes bacterium]|nr:nucleoside triphosphate pyrophosphohydrolase [Bacillota bacterium]